MDLTYDDDARGHAYSEFRTLGYFPVLIGISSRVGRFAGAVAVALVVSGVLTACASPDTTPTREQGAQGVDMRADEKLGFRKGHCRGSRVHTDRGRLGPRIPWVEAEGSGGEISGHLFYYPADDALHVGNSVELPVGGRTPSGNNAKVLWLVEGDQGADVLEVTATRLNDEGEALKLRFPSTANRTVGAQQFPSIMDLPDPGCWELQISAGAIRGRVVVDVVSFQ